MSKNNLIIFKRKRLIPAIIQDCQKNVLMLGYVNKNAFEKTLETGFVWFWSRSKNRLWMKGEKSGNKLKLEKISIDCDNDSLIFKTTLLGRNVCHKNRKSCFKSYEF